MGMSLVIPAGVESKYDRCVADNTDNKYEAQDNDVDLVDNVETVECMLDGDPLVDSKR